jgi:hypothetical protein
MSPLRVILALAAILVAGALAWHFLREPPTPPAAAFPAPAIAPAAPKGPQFPVEASENPLPKLAESDPALLEALGSLIGVPLVQKFFRAEDVVRRIVATIDNLPREEYAQRLSPVHPVPGTFVTRGKEGERTIAPENARRYEAYLRALESVEPARLVAMYTRHYPLFQQAYVELGYPNGYFNDRLVEVIDHLLAEPEEPQPLRVEAPKALFEYADPELEARSSGHKLLMRMGPENARRVKARLAAIRTEIVGQAKAR